MRAPPASHLLSALAWATLALAGSSTQAASSENTPPNPHRWTVETNITVTRLADVPHVIDREYPANLSKSETMQAPLVELSANRSESRRSATRLAVSNPQKVLVEGDCVSSKILAPEWWASVVICPFIRLTAFAGILVYNASATIVTGTLDRASDVLAGESRSLRMARVFKEHTQSTSLRDKVLDRVSFPAAERGYAPSLIVHIESAELRDVGGGLHVLWFMARSQVIKHVDQDGPAIEHLPIISHWTTSPVRDTNEWLASGGKLLRQDIDMALDALSANIVSLYFPQE